MYTPEEQVEHRKMWVGALRSGEYKQGRNNLCWKTGDTYEYCCLGVACEISGLGEFVLSSGLTSGYLGFIMDEEQPQNATLPDAVQEWLGLHDSCGFYGGGKGSLIELNDAGVPFTSIANIIESEPEGLVA